MASANRHVRSGLAYERCGSGEPLVLLHPLGGDRRVWRPVLSRLAAHRDVIAVDLPGFGESAPLDRGTPPEPRAMAVAVSALLRDLGIPEGRAHVGGNSLGGWVALEVALAGDAASVTAIAPAGLWSRPLGPKPELARRLARVVRPVLRPLLHVDAFKRAALRGSVAHPERVPTQDAADLIGAYAGAPGFSEANRAMRSGTFARLAEIAVPVTLVWPQHDGLVAQLTNVPPGIRTIVIPDAGHVPMWDQPGAVADALLRGSEVVSRVGARGDARSGRWER